MLTIHKNRVVSDVTLQQAAVRQKEPGSVGWRFLLYTTVIVVDRTTVSWLYCNWFVGGIDSRQDTLNIIHLTVAMAMAELHCFSQNIEKLYNRF